MSDDEDGEAATSGRRRRLTRLKRRPTFQDSSEDEEFDDSFGGTKRNSVDDSNADGGPKKSQYSPDRMKEVLTITLKNCLFPEPSSSDSFDTWDEVLAKGFRLDTEDHIKGVIQLAGDGGGITMEFKCVVVEAARQLCLKKDNKLAQKLFKKKPNLAHFMCTVWLRSSLSYMKDRSAADSVGSDNMHVALLLTTMKFIEDCFVIKDAKMLTTLKDKHDIDWEQSVQETLQVGRSIQLNGLVVASTSALDRIVKLKNVDPSVATTSVTPAESTNTTKADEEEAAKKKKEQQQARKRKLLASLGARHGQPSAAAPSVPAGPHPTTNGPRSTASRHGQSSSFTSAPPRMSATAKRPAAPISRDGQVSRSTTARDRSRDQHPARQDRRSSSSSVPSGSSASTNAPAARRGSSAASSSSARASWGDSRKKEVEFSITDFEKKFLGESRRPDDFWHKYGGPPKEQLGDPKPAPRPPNRKLEDADPEKLDKKGSGFKNPELTSDELPDLVPHDVGTKIVPPSNPIPPYRGFSQPTPSVGAKPDSADASSYDRRLHHNEVSSASTNIAQSGRDNQTGEGRGWDGRRPAASKRPQQDDTFDRRTDHSNKRRRFDSAQPSESLQRPSEPGSRGSGRGRGRNMTLPAWMTGNQQTDTLRAGNNSASGTNTNDAPPQQGSSDWPPSRGAPGSGRGRARTLPAWKTQSQPQDSLGADAGRNGMDGHSGPRRQSLRDAPHTTETRGAGRGRGRGMTLPAWMTTDRP